MEIDYTDSKIELEKELNSLDEFVIDFISVLDKLGIKYVLISGYVAILFGRSRSSEDIDLFIEPIDRRKFQELWDELGFHFECLNTSDVDSAYHEYLLHDLAIRFGYKGKYVPNMEIKFPKEEKDAWAIMNRKLVVLNGRHLYISPIEAQIPIKNPTAASCGVCIQTVPGERLDFWCSFWESQNQSCGVGLSAARCEVAHG